MPSGFYASINLYLRTYVHALQSYTATYVTLYIYIILCIPGGVFTVTVAGSPSPALLVAYTVMI